VHRTEEERFCHGSFTFSHSLDHYFPSKKRDKAELATSKPFRLTEFVDRMSGSLLNDRFSSRFL
jgi:hypothetical protein